MTAIDRLRGSLSSVAIKAPVRVATTANITLSGLQTIDGVTVVADDRVLVKDQTNAVENGIYLANTSAWSRASDFNGARDAVKGTQVVVNAGSTQTDYRFKVNSDDPIVIGTDEIAFEQISDGPQGAAGAPGSNGTNGASFLSGAGAPSSGLGSNGDTYINTSNGDVYVKAGGAWSGTGANLRGPQGIQGIQGPQGASGSGSGDMFAANNLSDLTNAGTARSNLGLGSLATLNTVGASQIDNDAVSYAKMQNVSATSRVLGRKTSGAGDTEELTLSEVLDFIGSAAQGDILYRGASTWARLAKGSAGQVLTMNAGATAPEWAASSGSSSYPAGHIWGLTLSNNGTDATNDLDIATGSARSADDTTDMALGSALTKRLDASWAVGTNQGGLDTGAKANSTTYHVWLIKRTDTNVVDVLFSASASSPTMPANYTKKRRIGSIMTDGTGTIRPFIQDGDVFVLKTPITASLGDSSSRVLQSVNVPTGLKLTAMYSAKMTESGQTAPSSTARACVFTSPDQNDVTPLTSPSLLGYLVATTYDTQSAAFGGYSIAEAGEFETMTDTSGRIYYRTSGSTSLSIALATIGWRDTRGRHA